MGGAAGAPRQPGFGMHDDMAFSQTGREERANAASHALGCVLALFALPALAQQVGADQHLSAAATQLLAFLRPA